MSSTVVESTLDLADARRAIRSALDEDLRYGSDATTQATVPETAVAEANIVARQQGVLSGLPVVLAVFAEVLGTDEYQVLMRKTDGDHIAAGESALTLRAPLRGLLTAERTALNFLCHLSGVATSTARWVDAVSGTGCRIRDSRKTLPGLRLLEKYAVRCGGGVNHRLGLGDALLIKDNHVRAAGSVTAALQAARHYAPLKPCEVEVDNLEQLGEVLGITGLEATGPLAVDLVLLDNFTPQQCAEAVRMVKAAGHPARLEASGGLTLEKASAYSHTGVDYLAVGALTHSSAALDLGLDL